MVMERFMASLHRSSALGRQIARLMLDDTALTKDWYKIDWSSVRYSWLGCL
jgi:hypothetical protein